MKIFITILVLMLLVATFWSVVMYAISVYLARKRAKHMQELHAFMVDINEGARKS